MLDVFQQEQILEGYFEKHLLTSYNGVSFL